LLSWLTEGRPVIASQDGASSGAIYPEMGGFVFSAFFFRINTIRGTLFFGVLRASLAPRAAQLLGPPGKLARLRTKEGSRRFVRRNRGARDWRQNRPEMAPQCLEKIESAPGNGMGSEDSDPQHLVQGRAAGGGWLGSWKVAEKGA
jgi:hypothetical protein